MMIDAMSYDTVLADLEIDALRIHQLQPDPIHGSITPTGAVSL